MQTCYIPKNQPDLTKLRAFLARPVHSESILLRTRARKSGEVDIFSGFQIQILPAPDKKISIIQEDFKKFMQVCMEVPFSTKGYPFIAQFAADKTQGTETESFQVDIQNDKCMITASCMDALRKAFIYLEEEMTLRRYPALYVGKKKISTTTRIRISRSPLATYRFGSGWELENADDYYPDEYLNGLAHCGINAIWVAGDLYNMIPSSIFPEINTRLHPQSVKRLQNLVQKAADYGIKVYFFCIEPRALPSDHILFEKHPEIQGARWHRGNGIYERSLCTSTPLVKKFMEEQTIRLFESAPHLAGLINIFCGERITTCRTFEPYADQMTPCPECASQDRWKILTEALNLYNRAMKKVAPDAELIAWSYGLMHSDRKVKSEVIRNMDKEIVWLECFEHNGKKKYFSRLIENEEYSLCYLGPSPEFKSVVQKTHEQKIGLYAKIQLGTTYEQSIVPYLPLPESAYRKCRFISNQTIPGVFVNWIIGGYPDLMLKAADLALRCPTVTLPDFLTRLAGLYWGEALACQVTKAWKCFFTAYQNYPIEKFTYYYGPISRCPAYHLYLKPQHLKVKKYQYNWGLDRARNEQPFYDVLDELWLGQYTTEEIITLYRAMARHWEKGVRILKEAAAKTGEKEHAIQAAAAETSMIQFQSAANVYEFYHRRHDWLENQSVTAAERLLEICRDEIQLAREMKALLQLDPRLGFQSELLYYVLSEKLLDDKITQTTGTCSELMSFIHTGSCAQ